MNINNLITRGIAGIVYVAVILFGVLCGEYAFVSVFALFLAVALFEFYRMTEKEGAKVVGGKWYNILSGVLIFSTAFLYLADICTHALPFLAIGYLLSLFVAAVLTNRKNIFRSTAYAVLGQVYITLPLCILMLISYKHQTLTPDYHPVFALAIFVLIWVNDTFAYLVGSLLGKHKLIERISPKKTIEGFAGGVLFSMIAAIALAHFFPVYPLGFWIGFGANAAIFGTLGDLFESLIKRTYEVKDSGNIIPGHGGVLDRIDSLLFVIPAIYLYLLLF